jgi:uncharacterized protein YjiS (DUF1127 family)
MGMAAVIYRKGAPDNFVWEEIKVGAPERGQVRLRSTAVGVNFAAPPQDHVGDMPPNDEPGSLRPQPLRSAAAKAIRIMRLWKNRRDGRRELANLSERELRDIGASRVEVDWELHKPFWRE